MVVLAQSASYPVVVGSGSIGPLAVPTGSAGLLLSIDRASLPDAAPLMSVTCMASFDGGQTFEPIGGGGIDGGVIQAKGGGTLAQSEHTFNWQAAPTHVRLDVDSAVAFNASFSVSAL